MRKAFIIPAAAILLAACVKDGQQDPGGQGGGGSDPAEFVRLEVNAESGVLADSVLVNGVSYALISDEDVTYVKVRKSDSYKAFYPARIWRDENVYVQPAQYYRSGGVDPYCTPMYADLTGSRLTFRQLMGSVRLTVKGSGAVSSISLTDNGGGALCGGYSYKSETKTISAGPVHYTSVTLNCKTSSNGGVQLDAAGTDFYFVLPAKMYQGGVTVNIELVDGHSMSFNMSKLMVVSAGTMLILTDPIDFTFDPAQIYGYHFDNLVLGSDPVGGEQGFKAADPSSMTGFEYLTAFTASCDEDGTADISTADKAGDFSGLGLSYAYSRNLQNFGQVHKVRECHGYLACGTGHDGKSSLWLPALTNLGDGIHKAEYSFRMAFQDGHKPSFGIQMCHAMYDSYSGTPGKVLELRVDGKKVSDDMTDNLRWLSKDDGTGTPILADDTHTEERIMVGPADFSNDCKWHEIKLVLGAVTNATVLRLIPFGDNADQPWYIDDIEATRLEYSDALSDLAFETPSTGCSGSWTDGNVLAPSFFASLAYAGRMHARNYASLYGLKYIDLMVSDDALFSSGGDYKIKSLADADWKAFDDKISDIVTSYLKKYGLQIWSIHLPYGDLKEGGVEDAMAYEWCATDTDAREAAVKRAKVIMKHLKPLKPKYWMVHTTAHNSSYRFDGQKSGVYYRDCGVLSFKSLVAYADSLDYGDGTHGTFTIENLGSTGHYEGCLAGDIDNMIWFCDQVPGLGICFDTGHSIVNRLNGTVGADGKIDISAEISAMCAKGCLKHLHVHGNDYHNDKDWHLMPGYRDGLLQFTKWSSDDTIDWGKAYKALVDGGYRGAFTYEYSTPHNGHDYLDCRDCIASWQNIVHNYIDVILKSYKNLQ